MTLKSRVMSNPTNAAKQEPKHDPRTFGPIPGIRVLKMFPNRHACYLAGVHGQMRAGIHGSSTDGAYSVVLSGGYDEDEDRGDTFVYTGSHGSSSGGTNDLEGSSGWNPDQKEDQTFKNHYNKSLQMSSINKRAVRVIRGYFKDKKDRLYDSPYAPAEGYRYDGLYIVDRAYMKDGKATKKDGTKYQVCAFDFRRIQGQLPIPIRGRPKN